MLNKIVLILLKIVAWIISTIVNLIFLPLFSVLKVLFPDFSNFLSTATGFMNDYLFDGLAFAREVFFNVTHFPREIISLTVTFIMGFFLFQVAQRGFMFVLNLWKALRKGE